MKYLQEMALQGIKVDWATVLVGWGGFRLPRYLSPQDVAEHSEGRLLEANPDDRDTIMKIMYPDGDSDVVSKGLRRLVRSDRSDPAPAIRKWILILLSERMSTLRDDPSEGLIQLTEFWEVFGFPENSPHVVQGCGNTVGPNEYYTGSFSER